MEIPNKNGVFVTLNHMVRPRNTHGQTRGIVMKLQLVQLLLREGGVDQKGS